MPSAPPSLCAAASQRGDVPGRRVIFLERTAGGPEVARVALLVEHLLVLPREVVGVEIVLRGVVGRYDCTGRGIRRPVGAVGVVGCHVCRSGWGGGVRERVGSLVA